MSAPPGELELRAGVANAVGSTSVFSRRCGGFTAAELLVSFTVLSILVIMLMSGASLVSTTWIRSEQRVETHQRARGALELLARELTPAVVDTRMQFAVIPGRELRFAGAENVAPDSPAVFWMAPLGKDGELRCVGYYLYRDDERGFHRLKRLFVRPGNPDGYFPRLVNYGDARDREMRTDPTTARWFLDNWDAWAFDEEDLSNDKVVVSSASDGIVGFWIQCFDLRGNPVPWLSEARNHPASRLIYNSAAFMHMATTTPFDGGETTVFLAPSDQAMKANRLPAEIEITLVTVDRGIIAQGAPMPEMSQILVDGRLDMEQSVRRFMDNLEASGVRGAEVFTTRVKLVNGT